MYYMLNTGGVVLWIQGLLWYLGHSLICFLWAKAKKLTAFQTPILTELVNTITVNKLATKMNTSCLKWDCNVSPNTLKPHSLKSHILIDSSFLHCIYLAGMRLTRLLLLQCIIQEFGWFNRVKVAFTVESSVEPAELQCLEMKVAWQECVQTAKCSAYTQF